MKYLLFSLILILLVGLTHVLYRKLWPSKKVDVIPLSLIALFWLAIYLIFLAFTGGVSNARESQVGFWSFPLVLTSIGIYLLSIPCYCLMHLVTVHEGPSIAVMTSVQDRNGISYRELIEEWSNEKLMTPRLIDLVASGCLSLDGGRYHIQPLGRRIVRIVHGYQKLTGLGIGG